MTPPALEHVVQRCLAKEADDRWQSAHDVAEQLRWMSQTGSQAGVVAPVAMRRTNRERLLAAAAILFLLSAGALAWTLWRDRSRPVPVRRSFIVPPNGTTLLLDAFNAAAMTMSPDGKYVTFAATDGKGAALYLYSLESGETRKLPLGHSPFWSPNSKWIAHWSDKLRKMEVSGGPALAITDGGNGRGGTWGKDGTIVFEPNWRDPLYRVTAGGGKPAAVTALSVEQAETTHRWPSFLPDGKHFIYLAGSHNTPADSDVNAIYLGSLDSPQRKLLLRARSNAVYADGYVLFVRENYLMAQPFDEKRLELKGEPLRLAQNVTTEPGFFRANFSVSNEGSLVYTTGPASGAKTIKWFGRDGKPVATVGEVPQAQNFSGRMSPDGKHAVVIAGDPSDLWIVDLERGTTSRFTSQPMQEMTPLWSPDGKEIAYVSDADPKHDAIMIKPTDGLTHERILYPSPGIDVDLTAWSSDGRYLLADFFNQKTSRTSVWVVPTDGSKPFPFIDTAFDAFDGQFSPDGTWVAFASTETGVAQIYAVPFPGRAVKRQLTNRNDIRGLRWGRDGILRFRANDGSIMAIRRNGDSFQMPSLEVPLSQSVRVIDSTNDGQRILVMDEEKLPPVPITLVTNWKNALR